MMHFQLKRQGKPVTDIEPFMVRWGHVAQRALGKDGAPFLHIHPLDKNDQGHEMTYAFTCELHPEVKSDQLGSCPKCGMKLVSAQQMKSMKETAVKPGEVVFHANFPAAGLYKVWGQFQVKGKMIIAPFTVRVR